MSFERDGYLLTADDGPQLWFTGTRMNVKAGGAQTGGAFTFIECPRRPGSARRCTSMAAKTRRSTSLDGQINVQCGDKRFIVGPEDFTFLPRGIPHTFLVTRGPVRRLPITAPAGFEQFIAEARHPAQGPGLPGPAEPDITRLTAAAQRHGSQILGPPPAPPSWRPAAILLEVPGPTHSPGNVATAHAGRQHPHER
jgi:hypothetical protein